ncbi:MAG: geranylgeranyl reductase family protein [Candidatus Aenigmarchaeota archaeon]|nr:geranylgeranyl reductase family protein [Candidatus Aenigmarchaeota archaeon]
MEYDTSKASEGASNNMGYDSRSEGYYYDIVIVGGGPGGSTCAALLGKAGKKVLLLDKAHFPRDKTCGDALSGSLRVQKDMGITEKIRDVQHAVINGVEFSSPEGVVVDIPFESNGFCCPRYVYDNLVFREALASVDVIQNFEVTSLLREGSRVVGVSGNGADGGMKEIRAKLVIGADGAFSLVARETGCHDLDPKHTITAVRAYYTGVAGVADKIELHFVNEILPGYFWIFPVGNGRCNVGVGMVDDIMMKKKLQMPSSMMKIINENPLFRERFSGATMEKGSLKGWRLPIGSKRRKMHGDGFVLVGDAAGLIDPFTGEGISNATVSGEIAANWAIKALDAQNFSSSFLKGYADEVWTFLGPKMKTSYRLQRIGRIKFLTNLIFRKAARSRHVMDSLKSMVDNMDQRNNIINPLFYLRLLLA